MKAQQILVVLLLINEKAGLIIWKREAKKGTNRKLNQQQLKPFKVY